MKGNFGEALEDDRFAWLREDEEEEPWRLRLEPIEDEERPLRQRSQTPADDPAFAAWGRWARLDERLGRAPESVREGWLTRMALEEAAGSARLDGYFTDPRRLLLVEAGASEQLLEPSEAKAGLVLAMVRSAQRRSPSRLFTPRRMMAAALVRRPNASAGPDRMRGFAPERSLAAWTGLFGSDRADTVAALRRVLEPRVLAELRRLHPLLGAARLLERWHTEGAAASLGGAPGRIAACAWLARGGLAAWPLPCLAVGFLGAAGDYAPWDGATWDRAFAQALGRSAARGLDVLTRLERALVLGEGVMARRRSHVGPALMFLVRRPAVTAVDLAAFCGTSRQGASDLLERLVLAGAVRELTGRRSFRLFALG